MRKVTRNAWIAADVFTNWSVSKGVVFPTPPARASEDGVTSFLLAGTIGNLIYSYRLSRLPSPFLSVHAIFIAMLQYTLQFS
jgi:hypothetical protein